MGMILILTPIICWVFSRNQRDTRVPMNRIFSEIGDKRYYIHILGYLVIIAWKKVTDGLNEPIKTTTGHFTDWVHGSSPFNLMRPITCTQFRRIRVLSVMPCIIRLSSCFIFFRLRIFTSTLNALLTETNCLCFIAYFSDHNMTFCRVIWSPLRLVIARDSCFLELWVFRHKARKGAKPPFRTSSYTSGTQRMNPASGRYACTP